MLGHQKTKVVNIDSKMPCQRFSKRFLCERLVLRLTGADVLAAVAAAALSAWHYKTRHFMSNNLLGVAFAVQGVEHIALGTYLNGSIMLVRRHPQRGWAAVVTPHSPTVARSSCGRSASSSTMSSGCLAPTSW